jgi:hypothetical protein
VEITAMSGDFDRADALVGEFEDLRDRVDATAVMVRLALVDGDGDRARELADRAVRLLRMVHERYGSAPETVAVVVEAVAAIGDLERAEALVLTVSGPEEQDWVRMALVLVAVAARARNSELPPYTGGGPSWRPESLRALAEQVDAGRIRRLIAQGLGLLDFRKMVALLPAVAPEVLAAIVDELGALHGWASHTGSGTGSPARTGSIPQE